MKNSLESLFGSKERWRLIKMFLLNNEEIFTANRITERTKVENGKLTRLLNQLVNVKFIKGRNRKGKKYYEVNKKFPFFWELRNLVIRSNIYPQCESLGRIKGLGNVSIGLISGVFLNHPKSKTDLLIVGDNISRAKLKHLLKELEAEMGREVNYCIMDMAEFKYRANMFDKFIVELLESPHEFVINKLEGEIYHLKNAHKKK